MPMGRAFSGCQRRRKGGFVFQVGQTLPRSNVVRSILTFFVSRNRNGLGVAPLKVKEAKPAGNAKVDMVLGADD